MIQKLILLVVLHISCTTCFHSGYLPTFQIDVPEHFSGVAKDNTEQVEELATGLGDVNDTLHNVLKKLASLQTNKQNTQTGVSKMESSVNDVKTSQSVLRSDMDSLSSVVKDLKDEVNHVSQVESAVADVKAAQGVLREDMDALSSVVKELKEEVKQEPCPTTAKKYSYNNNLNLCYKMYNILQTRDEASETCKSDGGFLISLDTQEKINFIIRYLNALGSNIHIAGHSRYQVWNGLLKEQGGPWTWPSGSTNLPGWAGGEPSPGGVRDCGMILHGGNADAECPPGAKAKQNFLCEVLQNREEK